MADQKAKIHVKKGLFALFTGLILMVFYQKWDVTGWLGEMDNVFLTMIVVIFPLIAMTETVFICYHFLKDKWENILD